MIWGVPLFLETPIWMIHVFIAWGKITAGLSVFRGQKAEHLEFVDDFFFLEGEHEEIRGVCSYMAQYVATQNRLSS